MALTLEQALGRPIETIEDAVLARAMFGYVKHGTSDDPLSSAQADLNAMNHTDFLAALAMGFDDLKEQEA